MKLPAANLSTPHVHAALACGNSGVDLAAGAGAWFASGEYTDLFAGAVGVGHLAQAVKHGADAWSAHASGPVEPMDAATLQAVAHTASAVGYAAGMNGQPSIALALVFAGSVFNLVGAMFHDDDNWMAANL